MKERHGGRLGHWSAGEGRGGGALLGCGQVTAQHPDHWAETMQIRNGLRAVLVKARDLESCASCSGFHSRRGRREREQL